jgi:hypothetical protein
MNHGTTGCFLFYINFLRRGHGQQGLRRQGFELLIDRSTTVVGRRARGGMVQVRVQMGTFFAAKARFRRTPMLTPFVKAIGKAQIIVTMTVKAQFLRMVLLGSSSKGARHAVGVKNNHVIVANQSDTFGLKRYSSSNWCCHGLGRRRVVVVISMVITMVIMMMMLVIMTMFVVIRMMFVVIMMMIWRCSIAMTLARNRSCSCIGAPCLARIARRRDQGWCRLLQPTAFLGLTA